MSCGYLTLSQTPWKRPVDLCHSCFFDLLMEYFGHHFRSNLFVIFVGGIPQILRGIILLECMMTVTTTSLHYLTVYHPSLLILVVGDIQLNF